MPRCAGCVETVRPSSGPLPRRGAMPALRLDGLALVAFTADQGAVPLAMESSWPELDRLGRPGVALQQGFARGSGRAQPMAHG